ncbi:hypothetical protein AALI59_06555 [Thomasclavelia cocleata]|uniref:hypothetical protein n=2 Tax=Thomasclavelia cocleata TaxID=69824 RepID=UPI00272C1DC6|nr:hypothetical protein [Thomasclavelia cocleata]
MTKLKMKRSYRVSDEFHNKLAIAKEINKSNGIIKNNEQIFDEMIEIYLMYLNNKSIFINDEIEKNLITIIQLYLTKRAEA